MTRSSTLCERRAPSSCSTSRMRICASSSRRSRCLSSRTTTSLPISSARPSSLAPMPWPHSAACTSTGRRTCCSPLAVPALISRTESTCGMQAPPRRTRFSLRLVRATPPSQASCRCGSPTAEPWSRRSRAPWQPAPTLPCARVWETSPALTSLPRPCT